MINSTDTIEALKQKMTEIQAKIEELENAARERASLDSDGPSCDEIVLVQSPEGSRNNDVTITASTQAVKQPETAKLVQKQETPQPYVHPDFRRKRIEDYSEYYPPNSWDPPQHKSSTASGCAEGPYESAWPADDEYIDPFK